MAGRSQPFQLVVGCKRWAVEAVERNTCTPFSLNSFFKSISMQHIHLFRHTGGGCTLGNAVKNEDAQCDDQYKCECVAQFRTTSNINTHYTMPWYIAGKEEPSVVDPGDKKLP